MDEGSSRGGGGGGETTSSGRVTPSYVKLGDRQIFSVELRAGETTFVSWKKLMKDAHKATPKSGSVPAPDPIPLNAHPNLQARIAPVQNVEGEANDAAAPNRFSAVIEKIERLYMGKDSSDDEDLKDVPDDDQYDTEDSFIDDTELDEYFEVDNSAIKHDGFFINRGKLERISEPTVETIQPQKKRRRKDLTKAPGESHDGRSSNKHSKVGKSAPGQITLGMNSFDSPQNLAVAGEQYDHLNHQNPPNTSGISSKKKSIETRMNLDPSLPNKVSNGEISVPLVESKESEKLKTGSLPAKTSSSKSKEASESSDALHMKYHDKSSYAQPKLQPSRPINNNDEIEASIRTKEKSGVHELPDLNMPDSRIFMQATKPTYIHKRDGSNVRPRGSVLEKAIRELEKMVAESRPPALDNQDADASSQAIKRRLPREIKLKLAKVARLAQASQGKISKELLNRLMSILGHIIQLRTLKRNLKVMISMGLSDKQQKDDRFQQMKKEVGEMIKTRAPFFDSKALELQDGTTVEFKESNPDEKGVLKRKFSMDAVLEEKICDLYDLFVDGLDEDSGPQVRKLYAELANLWPSGSMDNHGIKRAICRAKDRRRAMYSKFKDEEKLKKKKMLVPKTEETVRIEGGVVGQPQHVRDRLSTDSGGPVLALASKAVPSSATAAIRVPSPPRNATNTDKVKQERQKGSLNISSDEAKTGADGAPPKKKVKRKPELEYDETHFLSEKLRSQSNEERHKSLKQASSSVAQKFNLQLNAPSFEQSS